ncbi:MAG: OB-fold domain-containing protein [Hyphomonadaceae bacterium]|nr:OB-fold domain-containing protein [Hyphomonadaceae bacterium]
MAKTSAFGITSFGAYIPRLRLERAAMYEAHKWMAPSLKGLAKGERAFCSWDEDAITMAVEAARDCLLGARAQSIKAVTLASTTLPYADLQNSVIVAGALGLDRNVETSDVTGSQRAGLSRLVEALEAGSDALVVLAERPRTKPASTQEMSYGAGAAAFLLGSQNVIARLLGTAAAAAPFIDHFRAAGAPHDYFWEERWIRDEGYLKIIPEVVGAALKDAAVEIGDISTLVLPLPLKGAAAAVSKKLNFEGKIAASFDDTCGYAGAAHGGLMLASTLETAKPGDRILVVGFGQGATAFALEATDAIETKRGARGVSGALADKVVTKDYLRMLSFYNEIGLEWGMRSEKSGKAALTTLYRSADQLSAFVAGECRACGTIQFPQLAYCVKPECNKPASQFDPHSLVDDAAQVLTFTADWLSYHPAPPLYVGFVQFDNGARLLMEMVDIGPAGIDVGTPLRMVFRIKEPDTARGFNRYFWKATPVTA